ncbi:tRNA (adenosine(37)-N6)-dimethylallyltransferase MiaA [Culicoidibacter larvae]|uniref:tRNA dimethylallyltransferase n=1 Tax=Culicoidibacter larvae TaxID=2579976 RepID=A0A5R8QC74_9FIRM|nr:tRNA (adenosine(37)-N6)-dimethylallyltransferase MiaA [Culicoidibacter larvae]TLG74171.1 tRNA (adenosine(37)-N6)-dimethylallyltransferase MiaA [Culicoidibacter larvae]
MQKVLVIVGPTASGKTALSIELAKQFNGEIISGDSVQVYRGLDIGSAKVRVDEMQAVPHFGIDILDADATYSVADFQAFARQKIAEISSRGKLPIIAGGTGLYVQAVLYDYQFDDSIGAIDERQYDECSNEELYARLQAVDAVSAAATHANNRRRVMRSLAIAESGTKKSELEAQQQQELLYDALVIGLDVPRPTLHERINMRVDQMVADGLFDEVQGLYQRQAFGRQSAAAIGYKEVITYLENECSEDEAVEQIKIHTRRFAKRQMTWFHNQRLAIEWVPYDESDLAMPKVDAWLKDK